MRIEFVAFDVDFDFLALPGVDERTGWRFRVGIGLSRGVSERMLNWLEVLKTSE